ncbi:MULTISPECIES: gluconokinase [unclassified Actinomyces]|uniref:gluconokinase n=1 Tax=unclassified Actinomyces TaxID=2609248 RepID=UPI002016E1AC|nr:MULTISPECIES: gluconokinase [unclassified Actinomyces]
MSRHVVVMGVSGCGKSSTARAVAQRLGLALLEGDDVHPPSNVAKMAAGVALTDEDRWPWLERVRLWMEERAAAGEAGVVACSALRRAYRDVLRGGHDDVVLIELDVPRAELERRLAGRRGHFMPASLLDSQLAVLEPLGADERGERVAAQASPRRTVEAVLAAVRRCGGPTAPGDAAR